MIIDAVAITTKYHARQEQDKLTAYVDRAGLEPGNVGVPVAYPSSTKPQEPIDASELAEKCAADWSTLRTVRNLDPRPERRWRDERLVQRRTCCAFDYSSGPTLPGISFTASTKVCRALKYRFRVACQPSGENATNCLLSRP